MDDTDPDKLDAVRERLEAEQARRLAERIEAGEIVSVPLFQLADVGVSFTGGSLTSEMNAALHASGLRAGISLT